MNELLTTNDAAKRLCITKSYLEQLMREGKLGFVRISSKKRLVFAESVEKFEATRRPRGRPRGLRVQVQRRPFVHMKDALPPEGCALVTDFFKKLLYFAALAHSEGHRVDEKSIGRFMAVYARRGGQHD